MENSQIPHIAETTIYDGSFATPVLEEVITVEIRSHHQSSLPPKKKFK